MNAGLSYMNNKDNLGINQNQVNKKEESIHTKLTFAYDASERLVIRMGSEHFHQNYQEDYIDTQIPDSFSLSFANNLVAGFVEADVYLSNKLVARTGGRIEYSSLLKATNVAPRLSLAYKTG
jgi:outer membrane receptor for ferrienterochelin and colicin